MRRADRRTVAGQADRHHDAVAARLVRHLTDIDRDRFSEFFGEPAEPICSNGVVRPITNEGVAVGGAFDSDTATGMMPVAHRVAGVRSFRRS